MLQSAITKDNVSLTIDGVLFVKVRQEVTQLPGGDHSLLMSMHAAQVVDPVKASYGIENALYAVVQLAQTTMRSELGESCMNGEDENGSVAVNPNLLELPCRQDHPGQDV